MPPGTESAIESAAQSGRWEAVALVVFVGFVMVSCFGGLAYLVKVWLNQATIREEKMSLRINELEAFVRTEMRTLILQCQQAIDRNTQVVADLRETLNDRPCMLPNETLLLLENLKHPNHGPKP